MNKRDTLLSLAAGEISRGYTPAAFFMHFDPAFQRGQAAVDKHLEFFRYTGMDFVKIQYEQSLPPWPRITKAQDWAKVSLVAEEFFEPSLRVVEGLVKAAKEEALVLMTLYSPFMWAAHLASDADLAGHWIEDPAAVKKGLEILAENVRTLARGCMRLGVDGFYASSQGGEAFRFQDIDIFEKAIKPADLAVWDEIGVCPFNVLHICDYVGGYADLAPFLDYPGQVVNCSLKVGDRVLTPQEIAREFGRPFMGGLERKGIIASGSLAVIRREAEEALANAPESFILAADCTVPSETPWENLRIAIEVAHQDWG